MEQPQKRQIYSIVSAKLFKSKAVLPPSILRQIRQKNHRWLSQAIQFFQSFITLAFEMLRNTQDGIVSKHSSSTKLGKLFQTKICMYFDGVWLRFAEFNQVRVQPFSWHKTLCSEKALIIYACYRKQQPTIFFLSSRAWCFVKYSSFCLFS